MTDAVTRVHTLLLVLLIVMGVAIIALLASRAYGGPLDPPGPVGSTDGARGRGTPISSIPYPITEPGFYYLTRNLTASAAGPGITITASDVTLDLNGFVLTGLGADDGILVGSHGVVIRNGSIVNWAEGIDAFFAFGARYESLVFMNDTFAIDTGIGATLTDCTVIGSPNGVLLQGSTMRRCKVVGSPSQLSMVRTTGGVEIAENFFSGQNATATIDVAGNNIQVHDNYFGTIGTQVSMSSSANKVFLLGNWLSCSGVVDPTPSDDYWVMNSTATDDTNWCY